MNTTIIPINQTEALAEEIKERELARLLFEVTVLANSKNEDTGRAYTIGEACDAVGISRSYYYELRKDERLTGYLNDLATARFQEISTRVLTTMPEIIERIVDIATGENVGESKTAARDVLAAYDRLKVIFDEIRKPTVVTQAAVEDEDGLIPEEAFLAKMAEKKRFGGVNLKNMSPGDKITVTVEKGNGAIDVTPQD